MMTIRHLQWVDCQPMRNWLTTLNPDAPMSFAWDTCPEPGWLLKWYRRSTVLDQRYVRLMHDFAARSLVEYQRTGRKVDSHSRDALREVRRWLQEQTMQEDTQAAYDIVHTNAAIATVDPCTTAEKSWQLRRLRALLMCPEMY